ncbi:hypothetical protein HK100_005268 [Physocladia obscura]|uniref:Peptide N-acetyl-beta-D-glucosaminyl asparaginase amidase A N-terminal domain-containing protein n=1 Tax=Physocladia obscura TaxID=109957 RepID=A0AAD5XKP1_9FUNG|nr:hypothetical protein HK100_005268 [Physocladia obscura]
MVFRKLDIPLAELIALDQSLTARDSVPIDAGFPPAGYNETFQLSVPPVLPKNAASCIIDFGWYQFASSYGTPWVISNFSVPANCGTEWSEVVLTFESSIQGIQYDRVFQVWFDGAEAIRGCTDEPTVTGIWWSIDKDITDFSPILKTTKKVTVGLDNIVDLSIDINGVYNVSVKLTFYEGTKPATVPDVLIPLQSGNLYPYITLQGEGTAANFELSEIPQNIAKAELEFFVSHHQNDEFYYLNVPDSIAQPSEGLYGGGTFKELEVYIDGEQVGVNWPFQLIYTGGLLPSLWHPVTHIASENFPSYRFDLTAFAPLFSDGKNHTFTLNVTTQTPGSNWYVDGNLRIWLSSDKKAVTTGRIISSHFPQTQPTNVISFDSDGVDFNVTTTLSKTISYSAIVGTEKIDFKQVLEFSSGLVYTDGLNNVTGYHIIYATTHTKITDVKSGHIISDTRAFVSYPMVFEYIVVALVDDFSEYYIHAHFNHKRKVHSTTTNGGSKLLARSLVDEELDANSAGATELPPYGYFYSKLHNGTLTSDVYSIQTGHQKFAQEVRSVNYTVVYDHVNQNY